MRAYGRDIQTHTHTYILSLSYHIRLQDQQIRHHADEFFMEGREGAEIYLHLTGNKYLAII